MLSRGLILALLAILAGYGVVKALPLLTGPRIVLTSPDATGAVAVDGELAIAGQALHASELTLDGAPLLIDEEGRFQASLSLPAGGSILSLTAKDRFGRSRTLERAVVIP